MREGEHNLTVAVRVRPISTEEIAAGGTEIIHVLDDNMVVLMDPNDDQDDILRVNRSREKQYVFDCVFGPSASQVEVYNRTTQCLIENVISGFNATVFAYGATGTGKTYTMLGTDNEPGIMCLALNDLFDLIEKTSSDMYYKVTMSYLEIYNEMIRDLLNPTTGYLDLREDAKGVAVVAGISEVVAKTTKEVMSMLTMGNKQRTQEPTAANKTSSRSHAILQVTVKQQSRVRNTLQEVRIGKLFMIDLAGSERAAHTQNRGKRMIEGAHINRSLLALGNCINALCENRGHYVNYRDSKLTRLLKDSLGGNCRTVMIAHSSPDSLFFEETKNTLLYADRAKAIKMKVKRNQFNVQHHIAQYTNIIADLRKEIFRLKAKLAEDDTEVDEDGNPRKPKKTKNRKQMDDLRRQLVNTFNEQMEIRNKLMELENATMDISMETTRNMMVIDDWEQQKARRKAMRRIDLERERGHADNDTDITSDRDTISLENTEDIEEIEKKDLGTEKLKKNLNDMKFVGDNDDGLDEPEDVTFARDEINVLLAEEKRSLAMKSDLQEKLLQTRKEAEYLEGILPQRITSEEHREILGLLCKVHELEIHNAELKSAALLREHSLQQTHFMVAKYESRQRLCDEIIQLQRTLIDEHNFECPSELEALYEIYSQQLVEQDEQHCDSSMSRESTALTSSTISIQKAALLSGINKRLQSNDSREHIYSFTKLTPLTEESPSRLVSLQNSPVKKTRPSPSFNGSPRRASRPTPSTQNLFPDNKDGILRSSPLVLPSPPGRHSHTPSESSLRSSSPVIEKHEKENHERAVETTDDRLSPVFSRTKRIRELTDISTSRATLRDNVSTNQQPDDVTGSSSDSRLVVAQEKNSVRPAHSLSDLSAIEKPASEISDDDVIRKLHQNKNNQQKKNKQRYAHAQRRTRGGSFDEASRDLFVKPRKTRKEELQEAARLKQQLEKEKEKQMFVKPRGTVGSEGRGHVTRRRKNTIPKPPPVQLTDQPRQTRPKIPIKQLEPRGTKDGELQSFVTVPTPPSTVHQHNVPLGKGHMVQKKYRTPADIVSLGSLNSMDSGFSTPKTKPRKNKSNKNNNKPAKDSPLSISGHAVQPSRNYPGVRK